MRLRILGLLLSVPLFAQHVTLSCTGPCGTPGHSANCGYGFYRSADGGLTYEALNFNASTSTITPSSTCSYVDTNVAHNGATYAYYAVTIDPAFPVTVSSPSNVAPATMPLANAIAILDYPNSLTGSVIPPSITLDWATDPGQNVSGYDVMIEDLEGQSWVAKYWYQNSHGSLIPATQTSLAVNIPQNGYMAHIYFRTWFTDGTYGWQDVFYRETAPTGVPQILSPVQYTTQCSANGNVTFTWSSGPTDTANYYFHAGTSAGGWDIANTNVGLANSYTVNIDALGPRIVWVSVQANSPSKGLVSSDLYADAYVACHAIS